MTDNTLYYGFKHCLDKLQNPAKVEKYLHKLSGMGTTAGVLNATGAKNIISSFFSHPTCGQLARGITFDWMNSSIAPSPYSSSNQRCALSPEWEILMSKIKFDPLLPAKKTETNITKSDISAKKRKHNNHSEIPRKRAKITDDMEYSTMFSSKKNRTSMYNGKSISPPLSTLTPSSSHSSSSSISHPMLPKESKKVNDENRLKEILARIGKKKAEMDAKNIKASISKYRNGKLGYSTLRPTTQILGEFSSNSRSAQFIPNKTERIIGINGRQMIKISGRR